VLNLTTAIYSQISGSDFASDIGSRFFKGQAPEGTVYPYAVYQVVSDVQNNTFSNDHEDVIIQFSLYSSASGTTQIENMLTHLKALYDECSMSITDETLIWFKRDNAVFQVEDHTTPSGTQRVWAWYVDYRVIVEV